MLKPGKHLITWPFIPSGLSIPYKIDESISFIGWDYLFLLKFEFFISLANSGDRASRSAASDLCLTRLSISHEKAARIL